MQASKILLKILFTLQILVLAACNLPAPQERQDGNEVDVANFIVSDIKGESPYENLGADFFVPKARTFSFSVCVKDSARSQELVGHLFRVEEVQKDLKTDARGCMNWAEEVPFNFFSEPKYLQWDRQITARGVYRGNRKVRFAINPWNMIDKSPAVLNLDTMTASNLVLGKEEVQKALTSDNAVKMGGTWFTMAPLEMKFIRVSKESTSDREIFFNTKACIRSATISKNLRNYNFTIRGFSSDELGTAKTFTIKPDNAGCLNWDETINFKFYGCHKYFKGNIEIENQELAIKQHLEIAINPWETMPSIFGRDLRYVSESSAVITDCRKENILPSNLVISNFNYTTLSYGYDIDNALNLTYKKKLRFRAEAKVVTFSDQTKGRMEATQKIRPGVYLLKLALIKNKDYSNQKTYVTSAEQLISTLDGDIRADIELATSDLKSMGNRNTLLIELNPVIESLVIVKEGKVTTAKPVQNLDVLIDRSTNLETRTYSGSMILASDRDSQELSVLDMSAINQYLVNAEMNPTDSKQSLVREYIDFGNKIRAEQVQMMRQQSDINEFAKKYSVQHLTASAPQTYARLATTLTGPSMQMSADEVQKQLNQLAVSGKLNSRIEQGLCGYWLNDLINKDIDSLNRRNAVLNKALWTCVDNARRGRSMFQVEKRLFVKELGKQKYLNGYNQGLDIGDAVSLTNAHSVSVSRTKAVNLSVGLTQKFSEIFSIGLAASYNIAKSTSDQTSNSNSSGLSTGVHLFVQENIFELQLNRYEECSIVKMNPSVFLNGSLQNILDRRMTPDQKADVITRGLMICTGQLNSTPITRNEHYFTLSQDAGGTQAQDSGDDRNRNFFLVLRGENEYQRLLYFVKSDLKAEEASKNNIQQTSMKNLEALFRTGLPSVPGSFFDAQGIR